MRIVTQQTMLDDYMQECIDLNKATLKHYYSIGKSPKHLAVRADRLANLSHTRLSVNTLFGLDRDWLPRCNECGEVKDSVIEVGNVEEDEKANVCFDCIQKAKELAEPQDELISEVLLDTDDWDGPHEVDDAYTNYYRTVVIDDWMYVDSIAVVFNKGKFQGVQLYTDGYDTISDIPRIKTMNQLQELYHLLSTVPDLLIKLRKEADEANPIDHNIVNREHSPF